MAFGAEIGQVEDERWLDLYTRKLELEIAACFRYFRQAGFEPILFKGWAAARNYPSTADRRYTDIDLAFSDEQFALADLARRTDPEFRFSVDLHLQFRSLDTRPWAEIFADSLTVDLEGESIRIPSAEDHLRILTAHWLNDGGQRKDRLWDVYYAVANRPKDFDWERCLGPVSHNRRRWVIAAVGLANRYLGLDISALPFADEASAIPDWLVRTVEREWASDVRLRPLAVTLNHPREFFVQVKKRFPPNPIQATIEMDGDLFAERQLPYQFGSIRRRLLPSMRDLRHAIFGPKA